MKNSYKGYWFSCETVVNKNVLPNTRRWVLLLESKRDNKTHSVDLDDKITMGEVLELAYSEIDNQAALDDLKIRLIP
tara:strand:+ start:311 stop:541 length:231 start_codon:yes stop_codon:yes gene_type:complete